MSEEFSAASESLQESQIARKKEEVRLLASQTEARHLERKCESQAKELLRLREAAEKQQGASYASAAREEIEGGLSVHTQRKVGDFKSLSFTPLSQPLFLFR